MTDAVVAGLGGIAVADSIVGNHYSDAISGYRPRSLSCNPPVIERQPQNLLENPLRGCYKEWQKFHSPNFGINEHYDKAFAIVSRHDISFADLSSFLVSAGDDFVEDDGVFVSACLNQIPDKDIVFDFPVARIINYIGTRLDKDKILLIKSPAGFKSGYNASGSLVFYDYSGAAVGCSSSGLLVNCARAGPDFGTCSSGLVASLYNCAIGFAHCSNGLALNNGGIAPLINFFGQLISFFYVDFYSSASSVRDHPERFIHGKGCSKYPGLDGYLHNFRDTFMKGISDPDSVFRFIRSLGPNPSNAICEQIAKIVPGRGIENLCKGDDR